VEIPRGMWNQANPEERLRSCSYRSASAAKLQLSHQLASAPLATHRQTVLKALNGINVAAEACALASLSM